MKKILLALPSLNISNGVVSLFKNYLQGGDWSDYQFVILTNPSRKDFNKEYFISKGIDVYEISNELSNFGKIKYIKNLIKNGNFDIVHCNYLNLSFFTLFYAKKYHVKTRILHSHQTTSSEKKLAKIIYFFTLPLMRRWSNQYVACSQKAGEFMFKGKDFVVLPNSLDFHSFSTLESYRISIRKELKISNQTIAIGFIGRFTVQKNVMYFLKLMKYLQDEKKDVVLIMVGTGKLYDEFIKKQREFELKNIICVGEKTNAYEYYSAFDVFMLPSLFEGLPVVGIEAQASELPCIFSSTITEEVKFTDLSFFCDMNEDFCKIADLIERIAFKKAKLFPNSSKFNIEENRKILRSIYDK